MGARLGWLDQSWPIFQETGLPLIGGTPELPVPIPVGDDVGIYVIAPVVAKSLGLSLHNALSLVLIACTATGILLAIVQLWAAFRDWPTRLYAGIVISATAIVIFFAAGDVYAIGAAGAFILLPLCVLIARRVTPLTLHWLPIAILAGGLAAAFNLVRSNSGTGPLVAIVLVLLAHRATAAQIRALLVAGAVVGTVAMIQLGALPVSARDAYLMEHRADYRPIIPVHPVWYAAYIGFGFLSNPYGLAYKDDVAMEAARRIDPALARPVGEEWRQDVPAHERALRQATLELIRAHPFFALRTIFAKLGVVQLFVLLFGNLGLLGVRHLVAVPRLSGPLVLALGIGTVPGLLAEPGLHYLSAFVAGLAVTAVVGVGLIRDTAIRLP
jgi:hypothetical protein